jgi:hypothetical protein
VMVVVVVVVVTVRMVRMFRLAAIPLSHGRLRVVTTGVRAMPAHPVVPIVQSAECRA